VNPHQARMNDEEHLSSLSILAVRQCVKIDESNESGVEVCRRSSKIKSSLRKASMKAMAVEDNPHRYLDREIRYFDEQAAM
jgi:hypothetical protein